MSRRRRERFAAAPQYAAYAATALAVFGIGRRTGVSVSAALFGALVFATLPVVVLQAPMGLNDLVVASFLAACVYFVLSDRTAELVLAALALALALGTKVYTPLALPIVAAAVLFGPARRRLIRMDDGVGPRRLVNHVRLLRVRRLAQNRRVAGRAETPVE